jgi:hypothetical protein
MLLKSRTCLTAQQSHVPAETDHYKWHTRSVGRNSRLKAERRAEKARLDAAATERAKRRQEARERGAAEGARRGCLLCRKADGGFTSEEHILPESLGNTEKILPPGVICDRCNNEVCAPLDEALCNFGPVRMLRTMHQVPAKSGKLPSMRFDNGRLESLGPGELSLSLSSEKWRRDLPALPGMKSFSFTAQQANEIQPARLELVQRALVKQAIEFLWLDAGERALEPTFDRERSIVLEGGHHGYLWTIRHVSFRDAPLRYGMEYAERLRTSDGEPLLFLVAWFWGVPLVTDTLFATPPQDPPGDILVWTF